MTPKEAFIDTKLDVSHLKVFGSSVYVHIPKDKRSKLDPSSKKGISAITTLSLCDSEYHVVRVPDIIMLSNSVMRVACYVERFHNYSR